MTQFEKINIKLKELNCELIDYADSLEFEHICEFNMENCNNIPWDNLNCKGIYFIEIKNNLKYIDFKSWVENFKAEWEDLRYKNEFVSNLKKVRVSKHTNMTEWIPLYIGKSKLIKKRIHEHIFKELGKRTYALKLNARDHIKKEMFRLSVIKVSTDNYDWVMSLLEKTLRDKYNPIIGRQ